MNVVNQFNMGRRDFLAVAMGMAASATVGRPVKPLDPVVWFTEVSPVRHVKFQPTVINVDGSDDQGNLLPEFDTYMVSREIARQINQIVDPSAIRDLDNIPCCGMYCMWIRKGAQCQRYRFWVLWSESE